MKYPALIMSALVTFGAPAVARADDAIAAASYRLGSQDQLNVRVYDFRKATGEAYPWPALTGQFTVNAQGYVSLPIIGQIRASGSTTAELAAIIGRDLKQKVDLAELPEASVEVTQYRPFYVLGAVQKPGKFEYQPGLTVLQALSIAEGLTRPADLAGATREIVTERGDLRAYDAEHIALEARQARLAAEINGTDTLTYAESLTSHSDDPRVSRAMREESLLFDSRKNALRAELAAIDQTKVVLRQEITSLDAKGKSLDHQIEINKKQLSVVTDLLNKGMTDRPRQIAAEQAEATYESSRLDVEVASLRAQQDLSRADRDIIEIRSRFRKNALDDAAEVRQKLDVQAERVRTAIALLHDSEQRAPGSGGKEDPLPLYQITSKGPNGSMTRSALETDTVDPEDVLQVTLAPAHPDGRSAYVAETTTSASTGFPATGGRTR